MRNKSKKKIKEPMFIRRGFDMDLGVYNEMRSLAAAEGIKSKEWLLRAMKREIKRCRTKSNAH